MLSGISLEVTTHGSDDYVDPVGPSQVGGDETHNEIENYYEQPRISPQVLNEEGIEIIIRENVGHDGTKNTANIKENENAHDNINPETSDTRRSEGVYEEAVYSDRPTEEVVSLKVTKEMKLNRIENLLNTIGYVVGLGNLWKFSSLCSKYGGAVFITVYTLSYITIGLPLFILELYIGQYTSRGCIECWGHCKILKAIGVGTVTLTVAIIFSYNMVIVWSVKYFFLSLFYDILPWSNKTIRATCDPKCALSAEIYFKAKGFNLDNSTGIDDLGLPQWEIVLASALVWLLLFLGLLKGFKFSGKSVYFTVLSPYLFALILLGYGCTLDGAKQGLMDFMSTKNFTNTITNYDLWTDAAVQILFSLSLGQGGLSCLGSFNDLKANLLMNSVLVTLIDYFTSLFLGTMVFTYVGHVKYGLNLTTGQNNWNGLTLIFIIVPQALSESNTNRFMACLFFLLAITLGFDCVLTFLRTIGIGIYEGLSPRPHLKDLYINISLCLFGFIISLAMCTSGGVYLVQLINLYGDSWTMLFNALLVIFFTVVLYGAEEITVDIAYMLRDEKKTIACWKYAKYYFMACWYCVTPLFVLILLISKWIKLQMIPQVFDQKYPDWSIGFGWCISMCIPLSIIIPCIVYFSNAKGTVAQRFSFLQNSHPGEPLWQIVTPRDSHNLAIIKRKLAEIRNAD